MKIRTQMSLGYLALVLLLFVLGVYTIYEIGLLNRINQSLTNIDFQARKNEIEELALLEKVFDYDLKYWATQDVDYLVVMREQQGRYEAHFEELKRLLTSAGEQAKARDIEKTYGEYRQLFEHRIAAEKSARASIQLALDNQKYDLAKQLRGQYADLEQITHEAMQTRLRESRATRIRAQRIAGTVGLFSIVLAILLSLVLARRISSPLAKLIEGTHWIAAGKFESTITLKGADEFGQLAQALNLMSQQLGELDEMKRGFISHVSHELRSPLASIREITDLLLQEVLGSVNEKQRRLLNINRTKVDELSRRISDLLDISRIEAGVMEYHLEAVEISTVVRSAIESASPLLHEKNLCIVSEFESKNLRATVDSERILQVVENLLSNAIKFTRENSTIRVHCQQTPGQSLVAVFETWNGNGRWQATQFSEAEYIVVSVEDEGVGIAKEETQKIFEKFYQTRRGEGEVKKGTGLGLTICKNIVEAHNGVVWVESEPGKGSRFHFALPTGLRPGLRESQRIV